MAAKDRVGPGSPMERIVGSGPTVECREYGGGIAMHWWRSDAKAGERCLCGKLVKKEADDGDA